jgi:hypothetical protein
VDTYRSADEASQDKALLAELLDALNGSPSVLRRDDANLWVLRGRGDCYVSTWGDGKTWQLVVAGENVTATRWTWAKKRLSFCEVTQDGDSEGCFRLHRLPTSDEAEVIRDIVGIRKQRDYSPEVLARLQEQARRLAVS